MNKFSCSLSCTWMTIIDYLFYAFDSLSPDVLLECIAKLVVGWLKEHPLCWILKGFSVKISLM